MQKRIKQLNFKVNKHELLQAQAIKINYYKQRPLQDNNAHMEHLQGWRTSANTHIQSSTIHRQSKPVLQMLGTNMSIRAYKVNKIKCIHTFVSKTKCEHTLFVVCLPASLILSVWLSVWLYVGFALSVNSCWSSCCKRHWNGQETTSLIK